MFYNITSQLYFRPLTEQTQTSLSLEKKNNDLNDFINSGENISLDEWDLIDEEKYTDDSVELNLARVPSNLPLAPSEIDNEYFKVRFEYAGNLNPQREFCKKMISAGKVYRKEDIDAASKKPVNKGWGPNGADTYDILKFKGGGDCHHYFIRKVYLKKGNKNITIANAKKLIRDLKKEGIKTEIPTSGEDLSTKAPKDMPYNGFLPTNKRFN